MTASGCTSGVCLTLVECKTVETSGFPQSIPVTGNGTADSSQVNYR
jgi:hypothetical protein